MCVYFFLSVQTFFMQWSQQPERTITHWCRERGIVKERQRERAREGDLKLQELKDPSFTHRRETDGIFLPTFLHLYHTLQRSLRSASLYSFLTTPPPSAPLHHFLHHSVIPLSNSPLIALYMTIYFINPLGTINTNIKHVAHKWMKANAILLNSWEGKTLK